MSRLLLLCLFITPQFALAASEDVAQFFRGSEVEREEYGTKDRPELAAKIAKKISSYGIGTTNVDAHGYTERQYSALKGKGAFSRIYFDVVVRSGTDDRFTFDILFTKGTDNWIPESANTKLTSCRGRSRGEHSVELNLNDCMAAPESI